MVRRCVRGQVGVLSLLNAEFEGENGADGSEGSKLKYKEPVKRAANMLGLKYASLEAGLVSHELDTNRMSVYSVKHTAQQANDAKEALAKAIYSRVFDWLIVKVNESLRGGGDGSAAGAYANARGGGRSIG